MNDPYLAWLRVEGSGTLPYFVDCTFMPFLNFLSLHLIFSQTTDILFRKFFFPRFIDLCRLELCSSCVKVQWDIFFSVQKLFIFWVCVSHFSSLLVAPQDDGWVVKIHFNLYQISMHPDWNPIKHELLKMLLWEKLNRWNPGCSMKNWKEAEECGIYFW